jgi:hypothetical protein
MSALNITKEITKALNAGYRIKLHYTRVSIDPNKRLIEFHGSLPSNIRLKTINRALGDE